MDAGLAAVFGAVAASLGGIAAAFAQHESVRISARADHRRERRQPRYDTYQRFIQTIIALKERVAYDGYVDTTHSEEEALRAGVHEKWVEVGLLGPEPVIVAASEVRDEALDIIKLMSVTRQLGERSNYISEENEDAIGVALERYSASVEYVYIAAQTLTETVDRFTQIASAALDDDGTRRRIFRRNRT